MSSDESPREKPIQEQAEVNTTNHGQNVSNLSNETPLDGTEISVFNDGANPVQIDSSSELSDSGHHSFVGLDPRMDNLLRVDKSVVGTTSTEIEEIDDDEKFIPNHESTPLKKQEN